MSILDMGSELLYGDIDAEAFDQAQEGQMVESNSIDSSSVSDGFLSEGQSATMSTGENGGIATGSGEGAGCSCGVGM